MGPRASLDAMQQVIELVRYLQYNEQVNIYNYVGFTITVTGNRELEIKMKIFN
jgi:hypothetical protein